MGPEDMRGDQNLRRKLNLGFLAIVLLLWSICACIVLSTMSVKETLADLENDIVPGAIAMSRMNYEATDIRMWSLTYIIRGNIIRDGKTTREWLEEEWATLEMHAAEHFDHERHIGPEEQESTQAIVEKSKILVSVSTEIV